MSFSLEAFDLDDVLCSDLFLKEDKIAVCGTSYFFKVRTKRKKCQDSGSSDGF